MNMKRSLTVGAIVMAGIGMCALVAVDDERKGNDMPPPSNTGVNNDGGDDADLMVMPGWNLRGNDIVWTRDKVGIKIRNPTSQFDMKGEARFRGHVVFNRHLDSSGTIRMIESVGDEMVIMNRDTWSNHAGPQIFGDGGDHFIMASKEGSPESAGIYGDGDALTFWSPGDSNGGQPAAYIYVLDEDAWFEDDDPYNGSALKAYLDNTGVWIVSDVNHKQNFEPLLNATDRLMQINGYTYEYKLVQAEIEKGQQPVRVAGLIAQEVIEVLPEAVSVNAWGEHFINLTTVTPLLVEALKDQIIANHENQSRIDVLEQQNSALEARLAALEAMIRYP